MVEAGIGYSGSIEPDAELFPCAGVAVPPVDKNDRYRAHCRNVGCHIPREYALTGFEVFPSIPNAYRVFGVIWFWRFFLALYRTITLLP